SLTSRGCRRVSHALGAPPAEWRFSSVRDRKAQVASRTFFENESSLKPCLNELRPLYPRRFALHRRDLIDGITARGMDDNADSVATAAKRGLTRPCPCRTAHELS